MNLFVSKHLKQATRLFFKQTQLKSKIGNSLRFYLQQDKSLFSFKTIKSQVDMTI